MKIAVFLPNWVGDVVMATPTLRALHQHFNSQAELVGVMRPYVGDVLAGTDWLDRHVFYNPRAKDRNLRSWTLVKKLRKKQIDVALLLPNSMRTGILAWLSGATRRIGYAHNGRGPLLTDRPRLPTKRGRYVPTPMLDRYLDLVKLLGCEPRSQQTELATTPTDEYRADEAWQRLELPPGREVVTLNSGAAYGAAKSWPAEYFAELARRIAQQHGLSVLVMCGPAERELAAQIALEANDRNVKSLADQPLSIGLSKAAVRRSRLLVSTDSGPRHFAAAFDVPVITIYGPTHVEWGDTHYPRAVHIHQSVPCGPCMKRVCPLAHHRCMREITVDRVYRAVVEQLEHEPQSEAA
jgi:heptosyltransferase-2